MRDVLAFVLAAGLAACSGGTASSPSSGSAVSDLDLGGLGGTHEATARARDAAAPADPVPVAKPAEPEEKPAGADFFADAQLLYRIAACGGDATDRLAELAIDDPEARSAADKVVARHCAHMQKEMAKFRAAYLEKHHAWFEDTVPKDIPRTVVYPFGGGDLLSALVAFPDATEVTTISLELAGDPRRIRELSPGQLSSSLAALRVEIGGLIQVGSNTSVNLSHQQRNELPGQVSSFLIGLVTAGYEPVAMRYFTLEADGAIRYLEQAEIDADTKATRPLKGDWLSPNFSRAFSHVEIRYRRPGESTVRVHRHFGWNLGDPYLKQHAELLRHLEKKGKVTILTKGASYLLQRADFSLIRNYMLDHAAWMLSDSTGIPPTYAAPAGMVQETYGSYSGAFLANARGNRHDQSFIDLWRRNPRKRLGFRFGYVDVAGAGHLVVTRPR